MADGLRTPRHFGLDLPRVFALDFNFQSRLVKAALGEVRAAAPRLLRRAGRSQLAPGLAPRTDHLVPGRH
jgi:hypothetical protein